MPFPALLALLVVGAAPPGPSKVTVLVVAPDGAMEKRAVELEGYLFEAAAEYRSLAVKSPADLLGLPEDDAAAAALKAAGKGYAEGKQAFEAKSLDEADRRLRQALKDFERAAPAMQGCERLCDTLAIYAAVQLARGDGDEAKRAVLDLLSLSPTHELERKRFSQEFIGFRAQVALGRNAKVRSNLTVVSKPSGARVFLNGEFQGFTPLTMQTLPVGLQLVRLERPGFRKAGELTKLGPEDAELNIELTPTKTYTELSSLQSALATEITRGRGGAAMAKLGQALNLDRAALGVVKAQPDAQATEFQIGYFELRTGKRLSGKTVVFQGDEYGQIKAETARLLNHLLNTADSPDKATVHSDPLEGKQGLEDWSEADRGGNRTAAEKKRKSKDPLDGVSGTEEW